MSLFRRLAALCAAYAVALQAIVVGFAAPQLDLAFDADALAVICAGAGPGDQPAPVERHDSCVLCVMPGGCAGHVLLDTASGAVVPTRAIDVAPASSLRTRTPVIARADHSHAARAPPAA